MRSESAIRRMILCFLRMIDNIYANGNQHSKYFILLMTHKTEDK